MRIGCWERNKATMAKGSNNPKAPSRAAPPVCMAENGPVTR